MRKGWQNWIVAIFGQNKWSFVQNKEILEK